MDPVAIIALVTLGLIAILVIWYLARIPPFSAKPTWVDPMTGQHQTDEAQAYEPSADNPWREFDPYSPDPNTIEIVNKIVNSVD